MGSGEEDSQRHADPDPSLDWDSFTFSLNNVLTDVMWLDRVEYHPCDVDQKPYSSCVKDCLVPLGPIQMHPASTILNYGQGLFEGMKAFRRSDGSIVLFRPDKNGQRMYNGAERLCLPPVPVDVFVTAADAVVRGNARWVPPTGKGALYLRPLLFGSGAALGVAPSPEATFAIYCSPVGNYFAATTGASLKAIRLLAVRGYCRAAPGGSGGVKAAGNYAPAFLVQRKVKSKGYDEALFLDAKTGECIEEAGASNFFAIFPDNKMVTPSLDFETILPGVTRASIIELAQKECGLNVVEGPLTLNDLEHADEAFCCGTGASITPVGSVNITDRQIMDATNHSATKDHNNGNHNENNSVEKEIVFGNGRLAGAITQRLYELLLNIQTGNDKVLNQKYGHWIHTVKP